MCGGPALPPKYGVSTLSTELHTTVVLVNKFRCFNNYECIHTYVLLIRKLSCSFFFSREYQDKQIIQKIFNFNIIAIISLIIIHKHKIKYIWKNLISCYVQKLTDRKIFQFTLFKILLIYFEIFKLFLKCLYKLKKHIQKLNLFPPLI